MADDETHFEWVVCVTDDGRFGVNSSDAELLVERPEPFPTLQSALRYCERHERGFRGERVPSQAEQLQQSLEEACNLSFQLVGKELPTLDRFTIRGGDVGTLGTIDYSEAFITAMAGPEPEPETRKQPT